LTATAHILIIDDDANYAGFVARAFDLPDTNHRCDTAAALPTGQAGNFDLILRVVMPGPMASELSKHLRIARFFPTVMSRDSYDRNGLRPAPRAADFLEKPISTEKLLLND